MSVTISPAYINLINSFKEECKEFIAKFKEQESEEFSAFAKMFKANKFGFTYEKYADTSFYQDFKEDSLQIAKYVMLNNNFIGGLYLIYGLYFIQDEPKQTVRLEYQEFEKIKERVKEERETLLATCEPAFVFTKLLKNEAFSFTFYKREFSMEGHLRSRLIHSNHTIVKSRNLINKEEWLNNFLQEHNIADDLRRIDKAYSLAKERVKQEHSELNLNLDLSSKNTINGMAANLMEDTSQNIEDMDIGERRRKLKEKPVRKVRSYKCNETENTGGNLKKKTGRRPKSLRVNF